MQNDVYEAKAVVAPSTRAGLYADGSFREGEQIRLWCIPQSRSTFLPRLWVAPQAFFRSYLETRKSPDFLAAEFKVTDTVCPPLGEEQDRYAYEMTELARTDASFIDRNPELIRWGTDTQLHRQSSLGGSQAPEDTLFSHIRGSMIPFASRLLATPLGYVIIEYLTLLDHHCTPNATLEFDYATCTFRLFANRTIEHGEFVTIDYLDHCQFTLHRRQELKRRFGIDCVCQVCMPLEQQRLDQAKRVLDTIDQVDHSTVPGAIQQLCDQKLTDDLRLAEIVIHDHIASFIHSLSALPDILLIALGILIKQGRTSRRTAFQLCMAFRYFVDPKWLPHFAGVLAPATYSPCEPGLGCCLWHASADRIDDLGDFSDNEKFVLFAFICRTSGLFGQSQLQNQLRIESASSLGWPFKSHVLACILQSQSMVMADCHKDISDLSRGVKVDVAADGVEETEEDSVSHPMV